MSSTLTNTYFASFFVSTETTKCYDKKNTTISFFFSCNTHTMVINTKQIHRDFPLDTKIGITRLICHYAPFNVTISIYIYIYICICIYIYMSKHS